MQIPTKHKRVICPECKGDKKARYYENNADPDEWEFKTCRTCKGEGLVVRFVKIWYKTIKQNCDN